MQRGFLDKPATGMEWGLLKDKRSKSPPSRFGIGGWGSGKSGGGKRVSTGGWDNYKYKRPDNLDGNLQSRSTSTPSLAEVKITDGPLLPQCIRVPKQAIQVWYARKYKNLIFRCNDYFQYWEFGLSHQKYFTSIFSCPITGERFLSGTFGSSSITDTVLLKEESARLTRHNLDEDAKVKVIWYRKKKEAMNAAAARALDCLTYRDGNGDIAMSYGLCKEDPYLIDEHNFLIPLSAPESVSDHIIIPESKYTEPAVPQGEMEMETEDSINFREDYRSIRSGAKSSMDIEETV